MDIKPYCQPEISLIIPTRERAAYLQHSIRTCVANPCERLEILILDNASTDQTREVVRSVTDSRVRYIRNESRLSMRDNFEKGLQLSRGRIVCFIGDDDGVFPFSVEEVLRIFSEHSIKAVCAARAHYFWPDLLSSRRGSALLPRRHGISILNSRAELHRLLTHDDYYRLPCLYHGFIDRSLVEAVTRRQGRFFLSSQVDVYSSIALSMEDIPYALSESPLIINGASRRSNGASHFGGGTEQEKSLWKQEDELGFLDGFENALTIGALILESGLRYKSSDAAALREMFDAQSIERAAAVEARARASTGRNDLSSLCRAVGLPQPARAPRRSLLHRARRLAGSFARSRPLDLLSAGIDNVFGAAEYMTDILKTNELHILKHSREQIRTALRMARK